MLYIHIPYCKGKCIYCDFYSGGNPDWQKYLKALVNELSERIGEIDESLSSIYIGGGTPSLIPPGEFEDFMGSLRLILRGNGISFSPETEFTIEVNPEDVDDSHIEAWKRCGVNRISMGVQSLVDPELVFLHRRHSSNGAVEAARILKENFSNVSLDLIYGIPGQTEKSLGKSLESILELKPHHISAYALTFEEGTPLAVFEGLGRVKRLSDDKYVRYGRIVEVELKNAGYIRYEISNYSLPGYHSRHNSGYWEGKPYLGLGPSAASYDGKRVRRMNPADLRGYQARFEEKDDEVLRDNSIYLFPPFYREETLSEVELMEEKVMVALRTAQGLNIKDYSERFGEVEGERLLRNAERWIKSGDMVSEEGRLSFTAKGWEISDYVTVDIIS